ncbi:hypothetical protein GCM10010406_53540 [Streptomyces thermolineatus]|uniref:Secreted protein n=1 Tax=Streptomyces thermolineatus TaxID=44033 RepID=A0ABN3MWU6_9ACTN
MRTYCNAAALMSSSLTSGATGALSVLMLRHMPPVSSRRGRLAPRTAETPARSGPCSREPLPTRTPAYVDPCLLGPGLSSRTHAPDTPRPSRWTHTDLEGT